MRKILNKDEYAYKDCKIRVSDKKMSDFLYAVIMTQSAITTTWGCGIYEYTRKQNGGNRVDVKIHIHPSQIELFETLSGVVLNNPIQIHVN